MAVSKPKTIGYKWNQSEYNRLPPGMRSSYLNEYVPENLREMVEWRREKTETLKAIDAWCAQNHRAPLPFVFAMSPRGEFPKWMWDSLRKGSIPYGKQVV